MEQRRTPEAWLRLLNATPSVQTTGTVRFSVVRAPEGRRLVVAGRELDSGLEGERMRTSEGILLAGPLSPANAKVLMDRFPYTRPVSHQGHAMTLGLGDRLGVASRGHIQCVRDRDVFPVLAQQSMRELRLTGRTYDDVLADVVFSVFEEQYTDGYGADGDHLKTADEVRDALRCGYTMITLDCSDQIDNAAADLPDDAALARYGTLPGTVREAYEQKYLGDGLPSDSAPVTRADLARFALVYHEAITYTIGLYRDAIRSAGHPVDLEVSVDETETPTDPRALYLFARELQDAGVPFVSMAPRFCGEFQKGIDYIGDVGQFTREIRQHEEVAEKMGFKLSVHSGSDKFSVFPAVGEATGLRVHVKTAGTSWLEAIRVIARTDPDLYRRMHAFAMTHLDEARAYYHIGTDPATVPALESTPNGDLAGYLDRDDSRQALHITYGLILQAENEDGTPRFAKDIHRCLYAQEATYDRALIGHIGRHLNLLGVG